jgi:hypothetical protein
MFDLAAGRVELASILRGAVNTALETVTIVAAKDMRNTARKGCMAILL